ncbi:hypothetical protein MPLA_290073 [Mesorhizobium sp. ORS 3359]|nr:hypothetical protein MPLA_290073 [Mesorhizobium sp. ORS 3359]
MSIFATFRPAAPPFALEHACHEIAGRSARRVVRGLVLGEECGLGHVLSGLGEAAERGRFDPCGGRAVGVHAALPPGRWPW